MGSFLINPSLYLFDSLLKEITLFQQKMAGYRSACTGKPLTLWYKDKPYTGTMKQVGKMAQDTYELWRTYDPEAIKISEAVEVDLATLHQKIAAGVNVTTQEVKNYLYSCTSMFSQVVEIDLNVSPTTSSPRTLRSPHYLFIKCPTCISEVNKDKYRDLLMTLMFSVRYLKAENPTHQEQLKKTIRKTKSNWNYLPWMNSITHKQLDDILAGYDWFLFLKETKDQPFRFGSVTTQWKDMGAFRDFCFISELFPGEPTRLIKWVQNPSVATSILMMHMLSTQIGDVGSSFPYCKAMGIVAKSDLSVTEHGIMDDYIH